MAVSKQKQRRWCRCVSIIGRAIRQTVLLGSGGGGDELEGGAEGKEEVQVREQVYRCEMADQLLGSNVCGGGIVGGRR
jgi:hypothetical protein